MLTESLIVSHESLGAEEQRLRRLVLKGPIAKTARAGQFVAVRVHSAAKSSFDPLLRRPVSIAEIWPEQNEIALIYRIQGIGTEVLARAVSGEMLSVMGPLGRGFKMPSSGAVWLIAGGLGAFPLYALAQSAMAHGLAVHLFWGGDDRQFLQSAGLGEWRKLNIPLQLTTIDGSLGERGIVTEPVLRGLRQLRGESKTGKPGFPQISQAVQIAACGPKKMLQAVTKLAMEFGVPVQVSLEERMGCAVGACLGCVCTVRDKAGILGHKKICKDGPVFWGEEVVWDELC